MVLLLTGQQWTHAHPFARTMDPSWIRALDEAAAPFRKSWSGHSELPYEGFLTMQVSISDHHFGR